MKLIVAAITLIVTMGIVCAAPIKRLPDNLVLTSVTGDQVNSSNIRFPGNWLIVYLSGNDSLDREVLAAMEELDGNPAGGRITVVVPEATGEELDQLLRKNQKLSGLRWTADTDRVAAKALELSGSNVIIGMRGEEIAWMIAGSRMEITKLRSMLIDWIR